MARKYSNLTSTILLAALLAAVQEAPAAQAPYYDGKTLKILVSSGTGGGTDTAARLVSRFIGKYLPGNPRVLVQNMPGGGGTIANNYFSSEAKPDGLTILQDSSSGIGNFVRGGPTIKYDPRKNRMIGGVARAGTLLMIRNDARDRLTNRNAKAVVVGDSDGIRSWVAMTVWAAEYLGWNLRWIYGYPGSRELQLAIRQGEIDIWATANVKLVNDLQREGIVQIVLAEDERRRADFANIPTFLETLGAKKPTGLAWQAFVGWAGSPDLDKFLVAPPGTPDNLVKMLREAFAKVMKDPEVDKEGDKFFGDGWKPITSERVEEVIQEQTTISKEAKEFITKLRQKYNLPLGEKQS
ncbi:MAG TPA: tripartite tricarboxylate transporter substrate-binding protein [Candidatus Binatia bacterium]|nr:tripartite tricarboxylate transporter substrate-binding protein [Candidatus Binatia bacterium]